MFIKIFTILLLLKVCAAIKYSIPDYVTVCHEKDPILLGKCWAKSFRNALDQHAKSGIPEMNLRKIDPIHIDTINLDFNSPSSSVRLSATLKNIDLHGLGRSSMDDVVIQLNDVVKFTFNASVPSIYIMSDYIANGQILLFQLNSHGLFEANYTDVKLQGVWQGERYMKNKKEHVKWTKTITDVHFNPKNIHMNFHNIIPTNEEISQNVNNVINENMDTLFEEIKPLVEQTVKTILTDTINGVYDKIPMEKLYPK